MHAADTELKFGLFRHAQRSLIDYDTTSEGSGKLLQAGNAASIRVCMPSRRKLIINTEI
jgi:hypothetical protein